MAERTWKLEHGELVRNSPQKFAIVGYEQTAPREMKALKTLEGLEPEDLKSILRIIHNHFHSED